MKKPRKENKFKKKKVVINSPDDVVVTNDYYYVIRGDLDEVVKLIDMLKKEAYFIGDEFSLDNLKEHIPIGIFIRTTKYKTVYGIPGTFLYNYRHNYDKYGISPLLRTREVIDNFDKLIKEKDLSFFNKLIRTKTSEEKNK